VLAAAAVLVSVAIIHKTKTSGGAWSGGCGDFNLRLLAVHFIIYIYIYIAIYIYIIYIYNIYII
jgi:hypothetical protein